MRGLTVQRSLPDAIEAIDRPDIDRIARESQRSVDRLAQGIGRQNLKIRPGFHHVRVAVVAGDHQLPIEGQGRPGELFMYNCTTCPRLTGLAVVTMALFPSSAAAMPEFSKKAGAVSASGTVTTLP